jgi:hypothetical protein
MQHAELACIFSSSTSCSRALKITVERPDGVKSQNLAIRKVTTAVRKTARATGEIATGRRTDFWGLEVESFMGLKLAQKFTACKTEAKKIESTKKMTRITYVCAL